MFTKKTLVLSLLSAILLVAASLLLNPWSVQAQAGELTASASSSCLRCHEDLYYNYDAGKHYCLTEASTRCVDCHDGDPEAVQVEAAHVGLVIYPIVNGDISRCETCHLQDAQAHVDTFAALAGYSPTVHVARQAEPSILEQTPVADERPARAALNMNTVAGIAIILTVIAMLFVLCILINKSCHV
ncbi:MAG: hypothetical protein HY781_08020 [Chloroflexi bacterium]|nr:hypothetical protein [Chloroflexota bacterium]